MPPMEEQLGISMPITSRVPQRCVAMHMTNACQCASPLCICLCQEIDTLWLMLSDVMCSYLIQNQTGMTLWYWRPASDNAVKSVDARPLASTGISEELKVCLMPVIHRFDVDSAA